MPLASSVQYFQKDMPSQFEADPESVINLAYSIKINHKKMKRLEKEYTTMKTKEKEDEIELRVSDRYRGPLPLRQSTDSSFTHDFDCSV